MLEYATALSGGIGSGKSSVAILLKQKGYVVIDADCIAHQFLEILQDVIVGAFGEGILEEGKISRKQLAHIIFEDVGKKKQLEEILHPKIREKILQEASALEYLQKPYFLDIPLFFEIGGKSIYPVRFCAVVFCTQGMQLERLCMRNHLSMQEAKKRINAQLPLKDKLKNCDFIIENLGSLQDLQNNTEIFLQELLAQFKN